KFIASVWATFITVALLIAYYYFAITGMQAMDANVDGKMLLPPDSQSDVPTIVYKQIKRDQPTLFERMKQNITSLCKCKKL
ncbi:hypothetical protein WUBG_15200, partial [Wuchereria bancrofti]